MTLKISKPSNSISELVHLRILATTDLHAHIYGYDYFADRAAENCGLARVATLIRKAREETPNHLTFDNGDFLQGTPLADHVAFGSWFEDHDEHPMMRAMNAVGYDAIALGNHEFNYGLDFLKRSIASANCPILAANLVADLGKTPLEDTPFVAPYTLLTRSFVDRENKTHSIRIGILGLLPPQTTRWDQHHLEGKVATRDMIQAAKAYIPEMRAKGADLVFLLAHTGIGKADPEFATENAAMPLAGLNGIDALVLGHTHNVLPGPDFSNMADVDAHQGKVRAVPAVMGGFGGSHLGVIDLFLDRTETGWTVSRSQSDARPVVSCQGVSGAQTSVVECPAILAAARAAHDATLNAIRQPVGYSEIPLNSFFAVVDSSSAVQLVHDAQKWYAGDQLKGSQYADLPIISAAAPFRAGGTEGALNYTDIPAGQLTVKHISDLYKHPNNLWAALISGRQLRQWLEQSARIFRTIEPGKKRQDLLDRSFPSYNFDTISGVSYEIDLCRSERRISDLKLGGMAVRDDHIFVLAASNFRFTSSEYFGAFTANDILMRSTETSRDVLTAYVKAHATICPTPEQNWRFKPVPDTRAQFLSSPNACQYLDKSGHSSIKALGSGLRGFEKFEIDLGA